MAETTDTADESTSRHDALRRADHVLGLEATVDQYRRTVARLEALVEGGRSELDAERTRRGEAENRQRILLEERTKLTADLAAARRSLREVTKERDRLLTRIDRILTSRSWRVGQAIVAPVARMTGRRR